MADDTTASERSGAEHQQTERERARMTIRVYEVLPDGRSRDRGTVSTRVGPPALLPIAPADDVPCACPDCRPTGAEARP